MHPGEIQWDVDKAPMKQSFYKFGQESEQARL